MFRSAVFKLTAFYFALLLVVCITFSLPAYSIASGRISSGAENQQRIFRDYTQSSQFVPDNGPTPRFDPEGEVHERIERQIAEDRRELLTSIIFANIAMLGLGTVLCYLFAKRTLMPIEKLHKAQSRFTSDASHELRTPLAVMKTEIEVALKQNLQQEGLEEILKSNLEEVQRLQILSDQLLALTRVDNNDVEKSNFDLSTQVTSVVGQLEKQYHVTINSDIDDNIYVNGIEALLSDLVRILVSNAIQYSQDSPNVSVVLKAGDDDVVLSVRDRGVGISPDDVPHIFERFYRGKDGKAKRESGHGLGLSLASHIAKQHGSRIDVVSEAGHGSTFSIRLKTVSKS